MYQRTDVKWREEGDGIVIFEPHSAHMFKLNQTGKRIWTMIEHSTLEEIVTQIAKEYEADENEILQDAQICLNELLSKGLIKRVNQ